MLRLLIFTAVLTLSVSGIYRRGWMQRPMRRPVASTSRCDCSKCPSKSSQSPPKKTQTNFPSRGYSPPKKVTEFEMVPITDEMKQQFVDSHNQARSTVSPAAADMVAVQWDDRIAEVSQKVIRKCQFSHSNGPDRVIAGYKYPLGENIYVGMSVVPNSIDPAHYVKKWDEERNYYNIYNLRCTPGKMCGHYTQVVWSTSRKIGCAIAKCPMIKGTSSRFDLLAICHYGPNGNWRGKKPYMIGKSCTQCPEDATTCSNNLCT